MSKATYLVSACLCGEYCRYDGGTFDLPRLRRLVAEGRAVPFCPECRGGLPTPRTPCEILEDRVLAADGTDCTGEYREGARLALDTCRQHGLQAAILKEGSPSCGSHRIRDGSHTGRKMAGMGVTAALLAEHGITLYTEEDLPEDV